jgi:hypothetical protein
MVNITVTFLSTKIISIELVSVGLRNTGTFHKRRTLTTPSNIDTNSFSARKYISKFIKIATSAALFIENHFQYEELRILTM